MPRRTVHEGQEIILTPSIHMFSAVLLLRSYITTHSGHCHYRTDWFCVRVLDPSTAVYQAVDLELLILNMSTCSVTPSDCRPYVPVYQLKCPKVRTVGKKPGKIRRIFLGLTGKYGMACIRSSKGRGFTPCYDKSPFESDWKNA